MAAESGELLTIQHTLDKGMKEVPLRDWFVKRLTWLFVIANALVFAIVVILAWMDASTTSRLLSLIEAGTVEADLLQNLKPRITDTVVAALVGGTVVQVGAIALVFARGLLAMDANQTPSAE